MLRRLLFAVLLAFAFAAHAAVGMFPWGPKPQFVDANGAPMSSGTVTFYAAGSTTPQNTYTDSTGGVANSNPVTLNSRGETPNEVWLTVGLAYKAVLKDAGGATVWTVDQIRPINDVTITQDEWVASALTPTYVSATSFTLVGDQTVEFHVGRRLKSTNSGGARYSTILTSAFAAVTTVTVVSDSGSLDSGLSALSLGLVRADNTSHPLLVDTYQLRSGSSDKSKKLRLEVDGFTTAVTRVLTPQDQDITIGSVARGHLAGLTLSTAGGSATMTTAAGQATDTTNVMMMNLASSIGKTTSAWAVGSGNGGIDTGAIANSTWYHFYLIMRPDTGVVDVLFSLSPSAPTMPANYTLKRRIGSGKTDGSAQWVAFTQDGDYFRWSASVLDVNTTNPGVSAVSATLTVPTGVNVHAYFTFAHTVVGSPAVLHFSDLAASDEAPSETAAPLGYDRWNSTVSQGASWASVRTNTSAQIRYRLNVSGASDIVRIATLGWVDRRGRDN